MRLMLSGNQLQGAARSLRMLSQAYLGGDESEQKEDSRGL